MTDTEVTWKLKDTAAEKPVKVPCVECGHKTKHMVVASYDCHGADRHIDFWIDYQIVQCMGCETVTYRTISRHSEDWDVDDEGETFIPTTITYFPSRSAGRAELADSQLLPLQLQRIYSETVNALNNDQLILAGIGIRALIETICKEKSASGSNLQAKIDWLVSEKILTESDAVILHRIRTLGNQAAHEATPHSGDQLSLALDICEHLLKGVYLIPLYVAHKLK